MVAVRQALVIGGGIGGLTVAIALQKIGVATRVIERGERSDRLGTGIILLGNALRALDRIGLADRCIQSGYGFDKVCNYDASGNLLDEFQPPRTFREDRPGAFGIMRPVLGDILESEAVALGAKIDYLTTVANIEQRDGGPALVELSTGEMIEAPLVIAADGAFSSIRRMVFGEEFRPVYTGQGVWRYTAPRGPDMDGLFFYRTDKGFVVGGLPLSQTHCYYFTLENDLQRPRFEEEDFPALFKERMGVFTAPEVAAATALIGADSAINFRPIDALFMPSPWHKGRVVLMGDAAHSLTPQLTSGGGLAIEDGVVLAEEVGRATDLSSALEAFEARRSPRVKGVYETSLAICKNEQTGQRSSDASMALLAKGYRILAEPF